MIVSNPNHLLTAPSQKPPHGRGVGLQTWIWGDTNIQSIEPPGLNFSFLFLLGVDPIRPQFPKYQLLPLYNVTHGFPRWLSGEESTYQVGDIGSIPGSERSPGGGNGNPLQYSFLGNPMGRGAWWATGHGVTKAVYDLWTKQQQHNVTNSTSYIGLACRENF